MADVFISYAREDRARAEQVARAIQAQGFEVFWDTDVPPGQTWADYIESKLNQCKAMIVLWSAQSSASQWVREEARIGRDRGKLIPVMLDATTPPFGFGEVQAANLINWHGDPNHPEWARLTNALRAAVGAPAEASRPFRPLPPPAQPSPQQFHSGPSGGAEQLSPIGYIQKCLRLYANGSGRARRSEYWWFALFQYAAIIVAYILDVAMFGLSFEGLPNAPLLTAIVGLGLIAPGISVGARRMHDVGLSGWLVLVGLVPYIGWLFILIVAFIPSKAGANQYGPNPKGQ